jgi:hypothetical protein
MINKLKTLLNRNKNQVSDKYLEDITGTKDNPDINNFLTNGLIHLLPDKIKDYKLDIDKATKDAIHSYVCHIDKMPKGKDCDTAKGIRDREADRYIGYIQIYGDKPSLMYRVNGVIEYNVSTDINRSIELGSSTGKYIGRNLRSSNHGATVVNQGIRANKPVGTFKFKNVIDNRDRKPGEERFRRAVNGEPDGDQSIGDRAAFFNSDGSVTLGADNIRNDSLDDELSADSAGEQINNGDIPEAYEKDEPKKTRNHPNKKKVGATNDVLGGIAALGGIVGLVAVTAALVPVVFVLDVITFFTTITTLITNVSNITTTFFSITDALLSLMGVKGATGTITKFINDAMDNAFGKENVKESKNIFAKAVNVISVGVKVAEKIVAARQGTDSKVKEVALQLGIVNNSLGEAGLIPPELMETSNAIDKLVDGQDEDFKDNLNDLTDEIKNPEESRKAVEEEQKTVKEEQDKKAKELDELKTLIDPIKSDLSKIKASDF